MTKSLPCFLLLFFLCSNIRAQRVPVKLTDMLRIQSVNEMTLTKDGSRLAFTVTSIEPDGDSKEDYHYISHLYTMPADGSAAPQQLTFRESSSQIAWSPDGSRLAFVRTVDGKSQIFLMSMTGGEPVQFTHSQYGAARPHWSADGRKIFFAASISLKTLLKDSLLNPGYSLPTWPYEQPGYPQNSSLVLPVAKPDPDGDLDQIRAYLDEDINDKKARVLNKLNFQDESDLNPEISFTHWFAQDLGANANARPLTHGFFSFDNLIPAEDGRHIFFTTDLDSAQHPDRSQESEIYIADADGTHLRKLFGETGTSFNLGAVSPSAKWLVILSSPVMTITDPSLFLYNPGTGQRVAVPFDGSKYAFSWSADEKFLYFLTVSHGGFPLCRYNLQSKTVEKLGDTTMGVRNYSLRNNRLVFTATNATNPFEIYSADQQMQQAKRITSLNQGWIDQRIQSVPEKHSFINNQGMIVEYWVMKPVHFEAGKKYPLLLEIHGGPSAMWGPGENSMWHEFQYFCGRGYGVVYCNPRGSGGYGDAFLRANIDDWGAGPASDVLTAMDKCISEGWADTSRLVVSGGSYGGYLVGWILGHSHRFAAGCSQRGVYDLATFFGEGNAWRLVPLYFGGYPWDPSVKTILQRESPITYVDQITTPYILFHGDNDRRTGFVQGEMMFRSLKVLDRPVEYVRHPGATHEITRSGDNRQRMDQMLRTYEFFERWIKHPAFSTR